MAKKGGLLYLVGGLVCAVLAVLVAAKFLFRSGSPSAGDAPAETEILLATKAIEFGTPLVLEGDDHNVAFVAWRKDLVLEGAFVREEGFEEKKLIAIDSFVRHQPILAPQVVPEDEWVKPGTYLQRVKVGREEMQDLKTGMNVDVFKIIGIRLEEFVRCARLYAIGDLEPQDEGAEVKPQVFLLLNEPDRVAFVEAEMQYDFRLVPSRYEEGPVLVESQEQRRARALQMLVQAQESMEAGEYRDARGVFEDIARKYLDFSDIVAGAEEGARRCENELAGELYRQAQSARDEKDYALCLSILESIEKDYPRAEEVVASAKELQISVQEIREQSGFGARYQALLEKIDENLKAGDFAAVKESLRELTGQFVDQGYEPEGADALSPDEAVKQCMQRLRERESDFDLARSVFESHVKQGRQEKARQKCEELKKQFPSHPFVQQAEKILQEMGRSD